MSEQQTPEEKRENALSIDTTESADTLAETRDQERLDAAAWLRTNAPAGESILLKDGSIVSADGAPSPRRLSSTSSRRSKPKSQWTEEDFEAADVARQVAAAKDREKYEQRKAERAEMILGPYRRGDAEGPSFFRDLLLTEHARKARERPGEEFRLLGRDEQTVRAEERLADNRLALDNRRLYKDSAESRALSITSGAGGQFAEIAPGGLPQALQNDWAVEFAARANVSNLIYDDTALPVSSSVYYPRFEQGAGTSVTFAAEGGTVTSSSPTTELVGGASGVPVTYASGEVELSLRLLDRSPSIDVAVTRSLAAQYAATIESQALNGAGSPAPTGLLNAAGIGSFTYTDGTPTWAELSVPLHQMIAQVSLTVGYPCGYLLMSPRRWAWIGSQVSTAVTQPLETDQPDGAVGIIGGARVILTAAMPTALGTGTNQDPIVALASPREVLLRMEAPSIAVISDWSGTSTMQAKIQVYGALALLIVRPGAVGVLLGTGMALTGFGG